MRKINFSIIVSIILLTTIFSATISVNTKSISYEVNSSDVTEYYALIIGTDPAAFCDNDATLSSVVITPSTITSPFVGFRSPLRCLIRVVFPDPFSPIIAVKQLSCIVKSRVLIAETPFGYV